ncbi:multifunctional CCA tRNA nucleotidyl transferase/2'3'-cyclic phosphodiesterase/2'nucleotidase/phosphatase [Sulfuriferula sp. AH1]|uniref:multifunctional CCA addition/repair protein n=1 Tax=Sulfuriferula sp. AH1 TaxID=1985873 RepID=UPI000B3B5FA8|nr:multifunctional CCA addition/repair protein [Sulfuriferula sp. AH1]ARU32388.1 multifunctional CCA tRNA nucleotidyl transferase/2'3'-cyclic phosphodiesterase/2'nucleotidase/phosphatase [Sulfuriferula sp. AH1]
MEVFAVGGAIRDSLLGLPVKDRDYVVVGATPEQMVAQGFLPVGKDFPVFLHPRTREEYALARTERKTAPGYKGFVVHADPDVTLEQDLARRDFTVNAIAQTVTGELVDPYHGQADLAARVFRHVSAAFAEDPVRILRAARFMARFAEFTIAPETMGLMRQMVAAGEVDHLVPERVWQELARGLMEAHPSRMFATLRECGALARIMPEIDCLFGVPQPPQHHPEIDTGIHVMMVVDYAASQGFSLPVRFAALTHDLGKGTTPPALWPRHHGHEARSVTLVKQLCVRLRVPNDCRDLAVIAARYHGDIHRARQLRAETVIRIFEATDAFRRPQRFTELLQACVSDARGRPGYETVAYPAADYLQAALCAAQQIDTAGIVAATAEAEKIGLNIRAARIQAIGRLSV